MARPAIVSPLVTLVAIVALLILVAFAPGQKSHAQDLEKNQVAAKAAIASFHQWLNSENSPLFLFLERRLLFNQAQTAMNQPVNLPTHHQKQYSAAHQSKHRGKNQNDPNHQPRETEPKRTVKPAKVLSKDGRLWFSNFNMGKNDRH